MTAALDRQIVYPDSDGQPIASNTKQFSWIVLLKENLECLFADNPDVFVAGDLLWYPVEGKPEIRVAPDVLVALGRPKGDRGSYRQWQEDNQPPQVVFEVLSPGNRLKEMNKKRDFYDFYGVEEYYVYDPNNNELVGLQRWQGKLTVIDEVEHWTSPLLGIHFELTPDDLKIFYPDRRPFLSTVALAALAEEAEKRAELAEAENTRLKELLRQAGIIDEG
ncbi:Uma2 family endonuclease [Synechocystis sp. PCC 7339]|uniref:Uma2 family endonuclease n=1 Tax=unclassified Synechocystis TaxID=2640012 RepID=UPI001BAFD5AC|nr:MULTISPECIES: Uma2 family endonuclease [unclassified Synechocystis]QUS62167.1 Uma2 family endonuclease [Synechocystis sp. PCC 7338]UAJ71350.1 Uma2 family endonuclease [Synechocystis sp. PCC 7339]